MNPIIDFYFYGGFDQNGRTIEEVWSMSDEEWESDHNFIQWLFPLKEPSEFNSKVPILVDEDIIEFQRLKFKGIHGVLDPLFLSFELILDFYGLEIKKDDCYIDKSNDFENRNQWLTKNNHNYLRITRILKSLCLFDQQHCLLKLKKEFVNEISDINVKYWKDAVCLK